MSTADFDELPTEATMLAVPLTVTGVVFSTNVAEVFPAGMTTVAGVVSQLAWPLSEIVSPPVGAAELIVTVPVLVFPPFTDAGLSVSDFSVGAVRVRVAVFFTEPTLAVIVANV